MENPDPNMEEIVENAEAVQSGQNEVSSTSPETADSPEVAQLKADLEAAKAKAAEYLDGWQRARADFANYKKRVEREQAEARQTIAAEVLARVFPALDDFELALKNAPGNGEGDASAGGANDTAKWAEGVHLAYRKLTTLLEKEGIVFDSRGRVILGKGS